MKKTFGDSLSLVQAATSTSFTAFGASEKFTLTGSEAAKTVTISLTLSGSTTWDCVDGNGTKNINKDPAKEDSMPVPVDYKS